MSTFIPLLVGWSYTGDVTKLFCIRRVKTPTAQNIVLVLRVSAHTIKQTAVLVVMDISNESLTCNTTRQMYFLFYLPSIFWHSSNTDLGGALNKYCLLCRYFVLSMANDAHYIVLFGH